MTIREAKQYFDQESTSLFDKQEAEEIFWRLLEGLTQRDKLDLKTNPGFTVDRIHVEEMLSELRASRPVQYITGFEWFYNLKFRVNEHVLIPRPETAELVDWIVKDWKQLSHTPLKLVDLGTGSGCIAISLKSMLTAAQVSGVDISEHALTLARQNADDHKLEVDFRSFDMLGSVEDPNAPFDFIVSNPPYITTNEMNAMDARVLNHEPHQALFVTNNDPLQFYKAILLYAQKNLKEQGCLYLELNQDFAVEVESLYQSHHFHTTLKPDMYGNLRMLKAQKQVD